MEEEDLISSFIDKKLAYKEGEYEFWDKIKEQFRIFAKENEKGFITAKELKFLKKCIEIKLMTTAKRIHRDNNNKLGFNNIKCIQDLFYKILLELWNKMIEGLILLVLNIAWIIS